MARNAAIVAEIYRGKRREEKKIVAALISTFDTGSLASGIKVFGTMVVVEIILLRAPASLSGVPSGAARFVLPGLAASKGMRPGIFKCSFSTPFAHEPSRACQSPPSPVEEGLDLHLPYHKHTS